MVDLKGQYNKIKTEIDNAIQGVIDSSAFIKGQSVAEFSKNLASYLNVEHVIPCGNGTDALQISLMALGLKPGDEVITTNFTFAATVEVIALLNLTPVLVDVNPNTFNIDVNEIENAITSNTKAIIPVHLFGQCADMESILNLAKKHHLFVIEDTAQAIGAEYTFSDGSKKKAGTMGDIGTTSFFPSKNLGCFGDGGAIFTNNNELGKRISAICNHGMYKRYYHDEIGVNSRLDSIQAAILNIKLSHLDDYNNFRLKAALNYNKLLSEINNIETPIISENSSHVFHQYTLKIKNGKRNDLKDYLAKKEIPSMVYYPVPLHQQKAYPSSQKNKNFKITNQLCEEVLSLPIHTELTIEQQKYICTNIKTFLNI